MELLSLYVSPVASLPFSSRSFPKVLVEKPFIYGQIFKFPSSRKYIDTRKPKFLDFRVQASGSLQGTKEMVEAAKEENENLVFVAGATGRVGSRTIRELLKLGFRVRAGVRDAEKAEILVQNVKQMKLDDGAASKGTQPVEMLDIVECDLENPDDIGSAIRNASVVVCCIGASEKEVFDITGPYRIDYKATKNLIDAATVAKVTHFILVTSLGTNKIGFPAAILNLFWEVLIWKRKAEESLIASGIPYTIVRPGGMERPTDTYKETHNLLLAREDTLFGGQVSNLQVAELMAFMAKNRSLSYYKVVEVIAETTAPLTPMEDLLTKIPSHVNTTPVKESQAARTSDPVPPKSIVREVASPSVEKEPIRAEVQATWPLSPYTVYDDLKPPTSPSPTPSGPKKIHVNSAPLVVSTGGNDIKEKSLTQDLVKNLPQVPIRETSHLSPYCVYDDLKPPTSPSPNVSTVSLPSMSTTDGRPQVTSINDRGKAQPPSADEPGHDKHLSKPKPRPLSPYPMYEDLKPPMSPMPSSPRKF